ncbi:MAG: DUF1353 domain-containing protein [Pseudomonadota bacterium]
MAIQSDISSAMRDKVELISAAAACRASDAPESETLSHLGLPDTALNAARTGLEAGSALSETGPTADALFERDADGFISALAVILVPGEWRRKRRIAAVARPFAFVTTLRKRERVSVVAPAQFETDFASIPIWARWLISPFGRHAEAAVIHDWLYAIGDRSERGGRRRADAVFRAALKEMGVGFLFRSVLHWSVRIGGGNGFGKPGGLKLRRLSDLEPLPPPNDKTPFAGTLALKEIPKARRGKSATA